MTPLPRSPTPHRPGARARFGGHKPPDDEDHRPYDRTTVPSHTGPADGTGRDPCKLVPTAHGSGLAVTPVNERELGTLVGQDEQRRTASSRDHHPDAVLI